MLTSLSRRSAEGADGTASFATPALASGSMRGNSGWTWGETATTAAARGVAVAGVFAAATGKCWRGRPMPPSATAAPSTTTSKLAMTRRSGANSTGSCMAATRVNAIRCNATSLAVQRASKRPGSHADRRAGNGSRLRCTGACFKASRSITRWRVASTALFQRTGGVRLTRDPEPAGNARGFARRCGPWNRLAAGVRARASAVALKAAADAAASRLSPESRCVAPVVRPLEPSTNESSVMPTGATHDTPALQHPLASTGCAANLLLPVKARPPGMIARQPPDPGAPCEPGPAIVAFAITPESA